MTIHAVKTKRKTNNLTQDGASVHLAHEGDLKPPFHHVGLEGLGQGQSYKAIFSFFQKIQTRN